jgi:NitT/TauT family transport system substrate-binding protein
MSALGCAREQAQGPLVVGGLPVTCNLTLPVACVARAAKNGAAGGAPFAFEYSKYSGWPEIKESLMAGRIQAAYMLAPLVMDLADRGMLFDDGPVEGGSERITSAARRAVHSEMGFLL